MKQQNKRLFKFIMPAVIGQVCFFLFTIIDGIFVGNGVGENALGAINIVMPFILTLNALFMLITVGGVTVYAVRTGRGDYEGANQAFMHALVLMLGLSVILTIIGVTLYRPLGYIFGANETYIDYVSDYMLWYSAFIIPSALAVLFQFFIRNDGSPLLAMISMVACSVLNIFLDWLFVFPLKMGIAGAAIATGISQCLCLLILILHFLFKKGILRIKKFKPSARLFGKILLRGAPETVAQFTLPVMTLCLNGVLLAYIGDTAINAFSVINYVASFSAAIFLGVSEGAQPLFGQAYGEKNERDLKYYFKVSVIIDLLGSALVFVVLLFIGNEICSMFGATGDTAELVVNVLPKFSWGFILMSLNTIISAYMYSTKRTVGSVILNIARSFVFTTAIIIVLPNIFGGDISWYTFGIYEALGLILAIIILKITERNGIIFK